jgi:serine/threonine-protein kinase HipA
MQALAILSEVCAAVVKWRQIAPGPEVELHAYERGDYLAAFEHEQVDAAAVLLKR